MIYFTADTHYYHTNIIRHCDRPFANAVEMNDHMIAETNKVVRENDTLWYLGDFAWYNPWDILNRIKCRNINFIVGNHDKRIVRVMEEAARSGRIRIYRGYVDTSAFRQKFTMNHFPMRSWESSSHGAWHLYGHVHGRIKDPDRYSMDVGVDPNNYAPVSWDQVAEHMRRFNKAGPQI